MLSRMCGRGLYPTGTATCMLLLRCHTSPSFDAPLSVHPAREVGYAIAGALRCVRGKASSRVSYLVSHLGRVGVGLD